MSRLVAVFEEGVRIFHEVAQLCADQRSALIRNDTDRLGQLAERAETLAARFKLLESVRREMTEQDIGQPVRAQEKLHRNSAGSTGRATAQESAHHSRGTTSQPNTGGLTETATAEGRIGAPPLSTAVSGMAGANGSLGLSAPFLASATPRELAALNDVRGRLSQAATDAALAAAASADLLVRASSATSAISRVLEGAASAGYLPNGELRTPPRSAYIEKRA